MTSPNQYDQRIECQILLESLHVGSGNSLQVVVHLKQLLVQLLLRLLYVITAVQLNTRTNHILVSGSDFLLVSCSSHCLL